jgi:hypothetical protein
LPGVSPGSASGPSAGRGDDEGDLGLAVGNAGDADRRPDGDVRSSMRTISIFGGPAPSRPGATGGKHTIKVDQDSRRAAGVRVGTSSPPVIPVVLKEDP